MKDGIGTLIFVIAIVAALVFSVDSIFNNGQLMTLVLHELGIRSKYSV